VIQGFRRGRAPRRLKLEAIGDPDVDLAKTELPSEGPMTLSIEVEVSPEFELPSIEKIAVKRPRLEATEERLNLAVENLQKYFGHWHDSKGASTDKDTLVGDLKIAGEDGATISEQPNVSLPVKQADDANIAGIKFEKLTEKLSGATPGSNIELEGTFPEDHPDANLKGKKAKITFTVKSVKNQHLPEVNQEFAEMLGFENVDALKSDLKERLVTQLEQETQGAVAQQVYRYLLTNTNLDLPARLSQRQMATVLRRRATEMMQRGVPEAEIVQQIDRLRISSAQQAAVDLRLFFIMSKLAEQFSIEVTPEEVNARIAAIAEQYGRRPEKLRSEMSASGQTEQLYLQIRDQKVVDKLVEMGEVSEVDEKTLAEEFKNLPPLSNVGPNVMGVSHSAKEGEKAPSDAT